jgi:polar amino acid transport system ATP-binding protein
MGELGIICAGHPGPADRERSALRRSAVAFVFQSFGLIPILSAAENVGLPLRITGAGQRVREERVRLVLDIVGLADHARQRPAELSGGQQQRVAIARALALQPRLLLFDEPTSALDPELVGEVLAVIRDLAQSGMTMIVVTHEIGFAREVADSVVFLDEGRIVESGAPARVLTDPGHERARAFLAAVL